MRIDLHLCFVNAVTYLYYCLCECLPLWSEKISSCCLLTCMRVDSTLPSHSAMTLDLMTFMYGCLTLSMAACTVLSKVCHLYVLHSSSYSAGIIP